MKARIDAIIQREQAEYLDQLLPQHDPLLTEMEAYAAEHRVPIADREVAAFIEITARASGARKALEIGMAIGYSVVHLARGMGEQGRVTTIEPNDEMIRAASGYLERAGLLDRVNIERGKALEVMPRLNETFDLLFIDAVKDTEASTVALREFNPYFINHPQLRSVVLPVGDGLGYAVKTN